MQTRSYRVNSLLKIVRNRQFYCGSLLVLLCMPAMPALALLLNLNLLTTATMGVDWLTTNSSKSEITSADELHLFNGVVTTTSKAYDLSTTTSADLNFHVYVPYSLLSVLSSAPNPGEDLMAEYKAADGSWKHLETFVAGSGFLGLLFISGYYEFAEALPSDAFHSDFRVRYTMLGGGANLFDLSGDHWYVSDLNLNATVTPPGPDHFELDFTSTGLTCNPHSVTLRACEDASCATLFTGSVTATLSPTGWSGGDTVTFSGGSTTASLVHTSTGTVSLGVASSTPVTYGGSNLCRIDGGAASTFCDLTFSDSGLIVDVPDFIANRGTSAVTVKAVKTDETQQCAPGFSNVSKNIQLWQTYVSPGSGTRTVAVNGAAVGAGSGSPSTQSLSFDGNGEASINVNYSDAGLVQLNLKYEGSGADAGLLMEGYDQFITRPAGFCVSASATCTAGDASCAAFAVAGSAFNLNVIPQAWQLDSDSDFCDNPLSTPNYADANLTISSTLVAPSGGVNGTVTPASYNHLVGDTQVSVAQSEVGVFQFTVDPPVYWGYELGTFTSEPVGRFYPDHFRAAVTVDGEIAAACSGVMNAFTYSGETTSWMAQPQWSLTAENANNQVTQNYTQAGFNRLSATDVSVTVPVADNTALGSGGSPLPVTVTDSPGSLSVSASAGTVLFELNVLDEIRYDRSLLSQVAPFTPDLSWTLNSATDSDGANLLATSTVTPGTSFVVRFGRLWLEDAYGPETENLTVPLRAEFYNGSRYVINTDDQCTVWDSANATLSGTAGLTSLLASSGVLSAGTSGGYGLLLQAPVTLSGSPLTGQADVNYTPPAWLDGSIIPVSGFANPQGTVTFGLFRGHQRRIFQREMR